MGDGIAVIDLTATLTGALQQADDLRTEATRLIEAAAVLRDTANQLEALVAVLSGHG